MKVPESDSQPLSEQYINGDFRHKHLIPIVIASKKIYLNQSGRAKSDGDSYD